MDKEILGAALPLFKLGRLVATPGALEVIKQSGDNPLLYFRRHARGEWGEVPAEDGRANEAAVKEGLRILSAYLTSGGERIWVITEADRSSTCILLPDEY